MTMMGRSFAAVVTVAGGVLFSQAPEFAQQYRQRMGGAVDELRVIVENFENQAGERGLDRERALGVYAGAADDFLRSQGTSMRHTLERFDHLTAQQQQFITTSPVAQPLVLLRSADDTLLFNALQDFQPAVPVTIAGLVWAIIGAITLGMVSGTLRYAGRRRSSPAKHALSPPPIQANADDLRRERVAADSRPGSEAAFRPADGRAPAPVSAVPADRKA